jgi:2-polyprenyl-3-methyl-5-hydroxy-6-metoxy-1,4-benzoquinol methylase
MSTTIQQDDWDKHWEQYADSAAENPAQEYRRRLVLSLLGIEGDGSGARILDIGAGQGDFAADLVKLLPGATVLGLELSQTGVEVARRKVPAARFFQCDLLQEAAVPDDLKNWATHAVCSEVLEHLDQPQTLLRNVKGYLAPGCRLIVTVPGGPMSAFDKHIGHRRHYTPEMMTQVLRDAGFQPQQATGAGFPFFNVYRSVVILRGDKLVEDVASDGRQSALALFVMRVFKVLFRLNVPASRWGWQTVAVASKPT